MNRLMINAATVALLILIPQLLMGSEVHARASSIVAVCLFLWIRGIVPPFVPTLLLWTLVPLLIGPLDARFTLPRVLAFAADPVMALFFGGFALGTATERNGFDRRLTHFAFRISGHSFRQFLLLVIMITAFLSMWMSTIAAAALMLACLHPVVHEFENNDILRRSLLVGVALGADMGGIATPIGTGPNAIAIASIADAQQVSFLSWMAFGLPLTIGLLTASYLFLLWRVGRRDGAWLLTTGRFNGAVAGNGGSPNSRFGIVIFLSIFIGTVALWLTEPLHRVPAAVIALGSTAALFLSGALAKEDLFRIDWPTLFLIAGGITIGRLLEQTETVASVAAYVPFSDLDPTASLFILCMASALLSALMSNTATAVLLIPLATTLIPAPSTAILIAVSASFGIPFVISTPPNAMVFGQGGVKFGDLFWPGIILMILGCLLVSVTGRAVLNLVGIP